MATKEELVEYLKKFAAGDTIYDKVMAGEDVVVDDYAGGNVDDAYWKGHFDGQTDLARDILRLFLD
jgi:hypothetical protein